MSEDRLPQARSKGLDRKAKAGQLCQLVMEGYTVTEAADAIGISRRHATRLLRDAEEAAAQKMAEYGEMLALQQLEKLRRVREAAWEGWKRSLRDDRSVTQTDSTGGESPTHTTTKQRRRTSGDPRFLNTVAKAIDSESRILGVDQRKPREEDGAGSTPNIVTIVVDNREQRDEVLHYRQFKQAVIDAKPNAESSDNGEA